MHTFCREGVRAEFALPRRFALVKRIVLAYDRKERKRIAQPLASAEGEKDGLTDGIRQNDGDRRKEPT